MERHGPGSNLWLIAGGATASVLVAVWTSGQVAGLLVHGSWPRVSVVWSVVELVRVVVGGSPVSGIPVGLFWLCLLLEVGVAGLFALNVRRRVQGRHRHVWVPRPPEGIAKPHSFRDGYRRLVRADAAQAAKLSARRAEPAWAASVGGGRQERIGSLDVEQAARTLAEHFSREQLGTLIGELADQRMAGEVTG